MTTHLLYIMKMFYTIGYIVNLDIGALNHRGTRRDHLLGYSNFLFGSIGICSDSKEEDMPCPARSGPCSVATLNVIGCLQEERESIFIFHNS